MSILKSFGVETRNISAALIFAVGALLLASIFAGTLFFWVACAIGGLTGAIYRFGKIGKPGVAVVISSLLLAKAGHVILLFLDGFPPRMIAWTQPIDLGVGLAVFIVVFVVSHRMTADYAL